MKKTKLSIIAVLLISICVQLFAGIAFAAENDMASNSGAGHEYDNIDLEAAQKDQVVIETTVIDTNKAFSDIKDANLSKYAEFLNILGIFGGYGDGTFGPDNNITRGEMAAVVMRMYNYNVDKVGTLAGSFYDVAEDNIFYNDISSAVAMGIITGYDDNTYRPNNNISYTELVAILARVLGYERYAQLHGGYPTGYLVTAQEAGFLKGITYKDASALTRGEAATLVFNALQSPLLEQVSFGDDIQTAKDKNVTPLSKYFNIFKGAGVVNTNNITTICEMPYTTNSMVIDSTRYITTNDNYQNYIGYKVEFYYKDDNDTKTVVYMSKHKDVKELELKADDILSFANLTYRYEEAEDKIREAKINLIHKLIYNGTYLKEYSESLFDIASGSVRLIANDGTENYNIVMINQYSNFILNSISGADNKVTFVPAYDYKNIEIDLNNDTKLDISKIDGSLINYIVALVGVFDANGKQMTSMDFGKVPTNSVISVFADEFSPTLQRGHTFPSENAKYVKVIVSEEKVEGTLEAFDSETGAYIIDGKEYELAPSHFMNEKDSLCNLGDKGTFLLDCYGKLVSFTKSADSTGEYTYGYIINYAFSGTISSNLEIKLLTEAGDRTTFPVAENVRLNGSKATHVAIDKHLATTAAMLRKDFTKSQLIKFKTNEAGEITDIQTVLQPIGLPSNAEITHLNRDSLPSNYRVENDSSGRIKTSYSGHENLGAYFIPGKYFNVPSRETPDDETVFSVGGVTNYGNSEVELYDVTFLKPAIAIKYEASVSGDSYIYTTAYQSAVMVKDITMTKDEDGFATAQISVITGVAEKTYMAESTKALAGLELGDVVRLKTKGKDIVSSYERVTYNDIPITAANVAAGKFSFGEECVAVDTNGERYWKAGTSNYYFTRFGEVYATSSNNTFVVQAGPVINTDTNEREFQFTGHVNTNTAWQHYGNILYDATKSKEKPIIRTGVFGDLNSVYSDGAENASQIFFIPVHGGARQYIIYNGLK